VDLEGVRAEVMNLAPQIAELLRATPSEYSLLADAFRVDPAALGDPGAVAGAAFSYALDITDWLRSGDFAIDGIPN
jgi:hypothetical protein